MHGGLLHNLGIVSMCSTIDRGPIATAFDVLAVIDDKHLLHVKDVHTCQDVWVQQQRQNTVRKQYLR